MPAGRVATSARQVSGELGASGSPVRHPALHGVLSPVSSLDRLENGPGVVGCPDWRCDFRAGDLPVLRETHAWAGCRDPGRARKCRYRQGILTIGPIVRYS
jgi:hypothetical protein